MKYLQQFIVLMSVMALTMVSFPGPIFGQNALTLAIRGGLSRATLSGSGTDGEVDSRNGLNAGATVTVPIADRFSLQLGGAYVQKGARLSADFEGDIEIEGVALSATLKLDYIEVSALGKVVIPLGDSKASMHLLAGPAVAFNTKSEANLPLFGTMDFSENVKTADFGLAGGIGAEISISEGMMFSIDTLYTLGLQSIGKDTSDEGIVDDDVKNRAFTVQVGLGFPIGN